MTGEIDRLRGGEPPARREMIVTVALAKPRHGWVELRDSCKRATPQILFAGQFRQSTRSTSCFRQCVLVTAAQERQAELVRRRRLDGVVPKAVTDPPQASPDCSALDRLRPGLLRKNQTPVIFVGHGNLALPIPSDAHQ